MHMNAVRQSLYVCATKNCCALLTFTENFAALVQLQDFDKIHFLQFHSLDDPQPWMSPSVASFITPLHIPGNNIVQVLSLL